MKSIDKKHKALLEVRQFLNHIQPRIGEQAFIHIYKIVESAIKSKSKK